MQSTPSKRNSDPVAGAIAAVNLNINKCMLKKLAKNFDESENHTEYESRKTSLPSNIQSLRQSLKAVDLKQNADILSALTILCLELKTNGDWNSPEFHTYALVIEQEISKKYQKGVSELLCQTITGKEEHFDNCLGKLHSKLTPDDFKKYPSLIQVYHDLIMGSGTMVNPRKALPASLHLMNDHNAENKIKGLVCCEKILANSMVNDFVKGNYYEVVAEALTKNILEKSKKITTLVWSCWLAFLKVLPPDVQKQKLEDCYSTVLNEILTESNFYRQKILFESLHKLISMHQIECVANKKRFFEIITDNFNNCTIQEKRNVILHNMLECLEEWLIYCWCSWCYQKDHKLLTSLFLVLYITDAKEKRYIKQIQNIIITLIALSLPDQKEQAIKQMQECSISSPDYEERVKYILSNLSVGTKVA